MHSQTIEAAELLADAPRVDTPEKGYRVSRCVPCGQAYAWKGSARPGCPLCGERVGTTTRQLRASFVVLEGELLAVAERVQGGLTADATWERDQATTLRAQADSYEAQMASGELVPHPRCEGYLATAETISRGSGGIVHESAPARLRERAEKADAKAARYERRLAKLGGEL